jgi:hypothetical protein
LHRAAGVLAPLLRPAYLEAIPGDVDGGACLKADVAPGLGGFPDLKGEREGVERPAGAAVPPGFAQGVFRDPILVDRRLHLCPRSFRIECRKLG